MVTKKVESTQTVKEPKFTKEQLLRSKRYAKKRDAIQALLKGDETYTLKQVDDALEKFYKKGGSK